MQPPHGKRGRPKLWPRDFGRGVKVYRTQRKDGRVIFQLADPSQGRRKIHQFSSEVEATKEAQRIVNLLASGEAYAAGMRSEDRAAFGRAMKALEPCGVPIEIAATAFAEAVAKLGSKELLPLAVDAWVESHTKISPRPIREAVDDYIATKKAANASKRYRQDLISRLGRLAEAFTGNVDSITTGNLQAWMDARGFSAQTARNFRTVFTGFFGHAQARGWCKTNPAERITVSKVKGDKEPEIFTASEFARLLAAASKEFLPCLVLGGFCGLRSAEIERLDWEAINLASGEVALRQGIAKTKSRRIVPICDAAKAWLLTCPDRKGPVWKGTHEGFYEAQKATAEAATKQGLLSVPTFPPITWKANALRHGYASHRLAVTADAVRVAHEMGNSATVIHSHYKSLVSESVGKVWFRILPKNPENVTLLPSSSHDANPQSGEAVTIA